MKQGKGVHPRMSKRYTNLYFEDFTVGRVLETDSWRVTEDEVVAFGKAYARLPYHTDPEAAKDSMFGGLVAAGFQTAAISFGLYTASGAFDACGMGSPGCDRIRWRRPVRPGDELRVEAEVVEASPAREPGGRNQIKLNIRTLNQDGETVLDMTTIHYVKSRPD
jgi:acyl dehydratase